MNNVSKILSVLLLVSIGYIFFLIGQQDKQKAAIKEKAKKATPATKSAPVAGPNFLMVIHLDEPLPTLERMYNLMEGTKFDELLIGDSHANQIDSLAGKKGPFISGKDAFPREAINKFIMSKKADQRFIHFSQLMIKGIPLGIGSKKSTPIGCPFPNTGIDGKEIAQVIPWIKFADSPRTLYDEALKSGFEKCGDYVTDRDEGYVIDPGGFIVLLEGPQPKS